MICPLYDPIASNCAPSCCVCSNREPCARSKYDRLNQSNKTAVHVFVEELLAEQKKAALGATNTQNGRSRTTTNDSAFIVRGWERNCQV